MAKPKATTTVKRAHIKIHKKTSQGNGKFSRLSTKKGTTQKKYRGQGR